MSKKLSDSIGCSICGKVISFAYRPGDRRQARTRAYRRHVCKGANPFDLQTQRTQNYAANPGNWEVES